MINQQISNGQASGVGLGRFQVRDFRTSESYFERGEDSVLIVDDDRLFRRQLDTGLKRYGLTAVPADNRQMALEAAHQQRPHFAVLELRLLHDPNAFHSGLDLIRKLKKINPAMHIVVATAYSSIVTAIAAIKEGANDYLLKPTDVDSVAGALIEPGDQPSLPSNPMGADRLRWEYILRVFFQCGQNVSATARALGMHRRTLQRMLNKRPPPE